MALCGIARSCEGCSRLICPDQLSCWRCTGREPDAMQHVGAEGAEQRAVAGVVHDLLVEALDDREELVDVVGLAVERVVGLAGCGVSACSRIRVSVVNAARGVLK